MEILSSKDLSDTKGLTLPMNICMEFSEIKWAWNSQLSILDCILKKKINRERKGTQKQPRA